MIKALILAMVIVTSTGCTPKTVYVPTFIEASCPRIELVDPVPQIAVSIAPDGSVKPEYTNGLLEGATHLRRNEEYYRKTIKRYNKEFVDKVK